MPLGPGTGRGIAIAESYGTIAAHVVEVAMEDGMPKVRRVSAAIDCGTVIHPDTARQQVEGAIVMGLSAAMREEITLADGAVVEQRLPRLSDLHHGRHAAASTSSS